MQITWLRRSKFQSYNKKFQINRKRNHLPSVSSFHLRPDWVFPDPTRRTWGTGLTSCDRAGQDGGFDSRRRPVKRPSLPPELRWLHGTLYIWLWMNNDVNKRGRKLVVWLIWPKKTIIIIIKCWHMLTYLFCTFFLNPGGAGCPPPLLGYLCNKLSDRIYKTTTWQVSRISCRNISLKVIYMLAVFKKDYCFRKFPKHSQRFKKLHSSFGWFYRFK